MEFQEDAVTAILRMLWRDYGVRFCLAEVPMVAIKLSVLIEAAEEEAKRRRWMYEPSLN